MATFYKPGRWSEQTRSTKSESSNPKSTRHRAGKARKQKLNEAISNALTQAEARAEHQYRGEFY